VETNANGGWGVIKTGNYSDNSRKNGSELLNW